MWKWYKSGQRQLSRKNESLGLRTLTAGRIVREYQERVCCVNGVALHEARCELEQPDGSSLFWRAPTGNTYGHSCSLFFLYFILEKFFFSPLFRRLRGLPCYIAYADKQAIERERRALPFYVTAETN